MDSEKQIEIGVINEFKKVLLQYHPHIDYRVTHFQCLRTILNIRKQNTYWYMSHMLGVKIESSPDEWDRLFNVDFYIKIGEKHIGLQIEPNNSGI